MLSISNEPVLTLLQSGNYDDGVPSNALGISGGAPIERGDSRADSCFQKSDDLAGATRRPLHALVRRHRRFEAIGSGSMYRDMFRLSTTALY